MKHKSLIPLSLFSVFLVSCAKQASVEDYDVSNPYATPDYGDTAGAVNPPSDVNPAYDQPAVYEETTPSVPQPPTHRPVAQAQVHTVVRGDSLWSISKKYGASIDSIKQANGMTRDIVVLGAKLNIPAQ